MDIINKEKLTNLLTQNWTKFIEYKTLISLVINNVQLYAKNWPLLEYNTKNKVNKITISKTNFKNDALIFHVNFEVLIEQNLAVGTLDLCVPFNGKYRIDKIRGNVFYD